ncbi:hypothetical protein J7M28_04730 [bacterium]|nr:hypothetical protein [bacterium]
MTEESEFRPHLDGCRPAQGAANVSGSNIGFDIVDADFVGDLHFGALNGQRLSLSVSFGGDVFQKIIENGLILNDRSGRPHSAQIVPRIALTGSSLTGGLLTGRWRARSSVFYAPRDFFADGERIGVRVQSEDIYGYQLDETYYFTMNSWSRVLWPTFSYHSESDSGPLSVVPFFFYAKGEANEHSVQTWWGKDCSIGLDLDDAILEVLYGPTDGEGCELVENGYCKLRVGEDGDWQDLSADFAFHLGPISTNTSISLGIKLAVPEGASTLEPVMFRLNLRPIRACLTGFRLTGQELTGASECVLSHSSGLSCGLAVYASIMASITKNYLENHFIETLND